MPALTPIRSQRGLESGSSARRAGTCRLPMCSFQASGFEERAARLALKPTPMVLPCVESAIIVVTALASYESLSHLSIPHESSSLRLGRVCYRYEGTWA